MGYQAEDKAIQNARLYKGSILATLRLFITVFQNCLINYFILSLRFADCLLESCCLHVLFFGSI